MKRDKRNYKLVISYDGSRYRGWQRLKKDNKSIQYKIEEILSKLYDKELKIIGAGRTDAGVHARCQVANYHEENLFSTSHISEYLNHYLPEDIAITAVTMEDEMFHARYNVREKHYQYKIWNGGYANVFERKYAYWIEEKLDVNGMIEAGKLFEGRHDFAGFSTKSKNKNTVKTINKINIHQDGDMIIMDYYGEGFLYNMIRIITGTLIEIGLSKRERDSISRVFESLDREEAGFTAPSKGLCLMDIQYK